MLPRTADSYLRRRSVLLEDDTEGGTIMWDTVQTSDTHLSHDLPCPRCGHDLHTFLACGDDCACEPVVMPGSVRLAA
jgi:hypothetical protein